MVSSLSPLTGWGRGPGRLGRVRTPAAHDDLGRAVRSASACAPITVRGSGLSYGDAALPAVEGGQVLDMSSRTRLVDLDLDGGVAVVQSGLTLRRLTALAAPHGWRVPVLPGAADVTVGGAIASDVHGKNQPGAGSFGEHVDWMTLLQPDGSGVRLSPSQDPGGFWATVGGLGLTGVIDLVAVRLAPATARTAVRHRLRAGTLTETLSVVESLSRRQQHDPQLHVAAWLDATGGGGRGRALVDVCRPADGADAPPSVTRRRGRRFPSLPGAGVIGRPTIRAADAGHWWLTSTGRGQLVPMDKALLPLDAIGWWPGAFGSLGLVQYQLLLPGDAVDQLETVLDVLRRQRVPPALAVLKRFTGSAAAPLGFADAGWSMALDFPRRWSGLEPALQHLDDLVADHGGRVYLTKDSRLDADHVEAMYPRLHEWRRDRDRLDPTGAMTSNLGVRLGLVPAS
ncbi:MAG TPA: FAD-binding oxidoreductase [Actinomycetales bacterium]|nr:FAD-binding oxidoreductase [Actinomycetales bacterium]